MKNSIKIFMVLALLCLSSLMKSQQPANPFPYDNQLGCTVEITLNEYSACTLLSTSTFTIAATTNGSWTLSPTTDEVEISVNWVGNTSCPFTTAVVTTGIPCGGCLTQMPSASITNTCCAANNITMGCAGGVLFN